MPIKMLKCLTKRIARLENKVHGALTMMDDDTGKLLNYRQLLHNRKYKTLWCKSLVNEFGRLANRVGGWIKKLIDTICSICKKKVLLKRIRDVIYGQFVCIVRPKKAKPNCAGFIVGVN